MHREVMDWLRAIVPTLARRQFVCEFGSRNLNGSARCLFPDCRYVGVDLEAGPDVDVIADAADWSPGPIFDLVLCLEMLEHTPRGAEVIRNAHRLLLPGGVLLATCATGYRCEHSGRGLAPDGGGLPPQPGEHYANVSEAELREWLSPFRAGLTWVRGRVDLYAMGVK